MANESQSETRQFNVLSEHGDEKWLEGYQSLHGWSQLGKSVGQPGGRQDAQSKEPIEPEVACV